MDALKDRLKELESQPTPHFVLFTADSDPATGKPWCPDCVRCQDAVRESVASTGGSFLEVEVGSKSAWKDPAHPFRLDPQLRLSGIPTLFKYQGGALGARLGSELEAASSEEEVRRLLSHFCQ